MLNAVERQIFEDSDVFDAGDVAKLFELAQQKSQAGRETLFKNVWDLFENRSGSLSQTERALMTDILRRLSHDVEMKVRIKLAKRLADSSSCPVELIQVLANDSIEVAHPILIESKLLQDEDLVEIVRQRSMQHQLAVTMRAELTPEVCDALAESGNEEVVVSMLKNEGAKISFALMDRLASESEERESYQEPLLNRPHLPPDVAKKMYGWVSAALREYISDHFEIDLDDLDDTLSQTFREAVEEAADKEEEDSPAQRLVNKLYDAGQLTAGFALKSLRQGEVNTFELAMAKLSGLRPRLMRRIIYERGGEGLAITCRSIEIDKSVFLTLYDLTRKALGEVGEAERKNTEELRNLFDGMNPESAKRVLRKWQRDSEYLSAVKQFSVDT
jgi:uncharacterized protein (DUF2336 family)